MKHVDRICKQEVVERRLRRFTCLPCGRKNSKVLWCISDNGKKKHQKGEQRGKLRKPLEVCGEKKMTGKSERAAGDFDLRVVKRKHVQFMLSR